MTAEGVPLSAVQRITYPAVLALWATAAAGWVLTLPVAATLVVLLPADDPARCWTCGVRQDEHNAPHPFRRWTPTPRKAGP